MKTEKKSGSRRVNERRIQEKKRRRRSRLYTKLFYGFYVLTIAALYVVIFLAVRGMKDYVSVFEASQPRHAADAAARPFLERDYDALAQCEDPAVFEVETRGQYADYMDRLLEGRVISYNEVYSADEAARRYVVKADDQKIGGFTLRHTADDAKYGFPMWTLESTDVEVLAKRSYTVSAPTGATVYVNGRALGDDAVIQRDIPEFETVELPAGAAAPTRRVYAFERYFDVGPVSVLDRYGEACEVSAAGSAYTAAFNYDDGRLAAALDERVIQVVRRLSCYMTNDFSFRSLSKDLIRDSKAEKYVKAFDNMWIATHKSYDFLNMDVCNYVSYSDDCFSVETRYDYKIIYYTVDPEIYPTAYRLYFQKEGETWKLFDFTLI